jgi:hypothetical protein
MTMRKTAVPLIILVFGLLALFGFVDTASAVTEYINIPAAGFPLSGNVSYLETYGIIEGGAGNTLRTAVIFKTQSLTICRLNLYVHDNDVNDLTARLIRRRIATDGTPFGQLPETIAEVSSTGAADALRGFADTSVTQPLVSPAYTYWVEVEWGGGPIQFFGVRILTSTSPCP